MKCLITGCHVHALSRNEFAYGDLYEIGNCYVLSAERTGPSEIMWWPAPRGASNRILLVGCDFYQKDGVIVMTKTQTTMNDAAKRYVFGDKAVKL